MVYSLPNPKLLSKTIAATLLVGLATSASANDFSLSNNSFVIKNRGEVVVTATLGSDGVLAVAGATLPTVAVNTTALSNGLPSFEFQIETADLTVNSSNSFKIGLSIEDDSSPSSRRFEAYIGTLTLAVDGSGNVSGTIPSQDMYVRAKKGSATFYQAINNPTANGPFTISGGTLSFDGDRAVTLLKAQGNDILDAVLENFSLNGVFTFRVVIEENNPGANAARVGVKSGDTFTAVPRIATSCTLDAASTVGNVFLLFSDTGFVNPYVVQGRFATGTGDTTKSYPTAFTETCEAVSTGGGGTGGGGSSNSGSSAEVVELESTVNDLNDVLDDLDTTAPVDETKLAQIDSLNDAIGSLAEQLDEQIEQELSASTVVVSQTTVTSSSNLATQSVSSSNAIVNSIASGSNVSTTNILAALTAGSKTSASTSKVAAAVTDTTAKQALINNNKTILSNSASLLTTLSSRSTSLSSGEATAVLAVASNIVNTSKSLGSAVSTVQEIQAIVAQTNSVLSAQENLGIAADDSLIASISSASTTIANNFILQQLSAAPGEVIEEAVITQAITASQTLFESVLDVGLRVPPAVVVTAAETTAAVVAAYTDIQPTTAARVATVAKTIVNPENIRISDGKTLLSTMNDYLNTSTSTISLPANRQDSLAFALSGQATISVDSATGRVIFNLPGESYAGMISGVRTVPTTVPNGIRFRADGRATLVTNGTAIDVAPTAYGLVKFVDVVEAAGFTYTQNSNATFTLNLGDGSTFVGAFAYDNLTDSDLTSACGAVSVTQPSGALNSPNYSFGISCANGVTQKVVPSLASTNYLSTVQASGLTATTNRNTGVITISGGVGQLKPSFFTSTPTAAELEYHATAKDSLGIATQSTDVNGDGLTDYKVITSDKVQVLYGVGS